MHSGVSRVCCEACRPQATERKVKSSDVCELDECCNLIKPSFERKRFCRPSHNNLDWGRKERAAGRSAYRWSEGAKRRSQARRALKAGVQVGARFTSRQIFERDGWVCYLCTGPVNPDLRHPDPLSASLEHVIPLSAGGEHSEANCRLAHLTCNLRKGACRPGDDRVSDWRSPRPVDRKPRSRRPARQVRPGIIGRPLPPNLTRIFEEAMEMRRAAGL